MASVQLRLTNDGHYLPAIAIGARDIYGFALFPGLYLVASKSLALRAMKSLRGHIGIGVDWLEGRYGVVDPGKDIPVRYNFLGLFGGLDAQLTKHIALMVEYDTKKVNAGIRLHSLSHFGMDLALIGMRAFGGGLGLFFHL